MFFIRLDDASENMDVKKWQKVEDLLDKYDIKPIVGVIPDNGDPDFLKKYRRDKNFWEKARGWQGKGWTIALHGYQHKYLTSNKGINPFWNRSEFAGVPLAKQCEMLKEGNLILRKHGLEPIVFFAPSHTFDSNTIEALKSETDIRIISDTVARDVYYRKGVYFMPQQVGKIRKKVLRNTTKCVHPNEITDDELAKLEDFIKSNRIGDLKKTHFRKRKEDIIDVLMRKVFFYKRKLHQ